MIGRVGASLFWHSHLNITSQLSIATFVLLLAGALLDSISVPNMTSFNLYCLPLIMQHSYGHRYAEVEEHALI